MRRKCVEIKGIPVSQDEDTSQIVASSCQKFSTETNRHCQNSIGVRAGGGEGGCSPPKFWATQIFWAARQNLGKANF